MSKINEMEYHLYCLLVPQGTQQMISDLADSIAEVGLQEEIVTYEGRILDGRNRYLACKQAGVEPIFVEFNPNQHGDNPLQFVINKNFHRRHLTDHQRTVIAQQVWQKMKEGEVPDATMKRIAKMFDVSERTMRVASVVSVGASEAVKQKVAEGSVRLNRAVNAIKQAAVETGITVTKETSEKDRKRAHEAQDRIIAENASIRPSDKQGEKTPEQKFQERLLFGAFDNRRWKKNITEMQAAVATIERQPMLYHDCFELLKRVEDEALLNMMIGAFFEAVKKMEARVDQIRLQRDEKKKDFSNVINYLISLAKKHFPDIENDFGATDNEELNDGLRKRLISDCGKALKEVAKVKKRLSEKHDIS